MWSDLTYRIRALFQRKRVDRELEEELRSHFEHEVEKRVQQGQPRESAVREARLAFGGMEQVKEECRDARGISLIETNFFSVLGVAPQYGRYFLPGEDAAGAPVVVLSDHYRRSRFAADPSIVGRRHSSGIFRNHSRDCSRYLGTAPCAGPYQAQP